MVRRLVHMHGTRSWTLVAQHLPGRTGKQCRERWHNHLDHDIRKDAWSIQEDRMLLELHRKFGNRWADIASTCTGAPTTQSRTTGTRLCGKVRTSRTCSSMARSRPRSPTASAMPTMVACPWSTPTQRPPSGRRASRRRKSTTCYEPIRSGALARGLALPHPVDAHAQLPSHCPTSSRRQSASVTPVSSVSQSTRTAAQYPLDEGDRRALNTHRTGLTPSSACCERAILPTFSPRPPSRERDWLLAGCTDTTGGDGQRCREWRTTWFFGALVSGLIPNAEALAKAPQGMTPAHDTCAPCPTA